MTMPAAAYCSPANTLAEIVGTDRVITDEAERRYYSSDIFFWDDAAVAVVVVQPRTRDDVAAIVRVARELGMAISTRGGGMSYTKGYVPVRADTVLIDLRGLDEIFEINTIDNTATVGAGCTWIKLADAVKERVCRLRSRRHSPGSTPRWVGRCRRTYRKVWTMCWLLNWCERMAPSCKPVRAGVLTTTIRSFGTTALI
jgi:FAD/FMN-containing dehydrogenase